MPVPSRNDWRLTGGWLLALWLVLAPGTALAVEKKVAPAEPPAPAEETLLTGKLQCSLKRQVILPFPGIITVLKVQTGEQVKAGEVLARYRLTQEAILELRKRLSPAHINELEMKLAEIDKNLTTVKGKQREITQLAKQELAPAQSKSQMDREVETLARQRAAVAESLRQARQLAQEDLALLKERLGESLSRGQIPKEASLKAPINGHVIWVQPELRQGAELPSGTRVFQVGVMNPMLVRAQAYEIEALKLNVGDKAEITIESLPGRKFEARVTRLSWAPTTPAPDQPTYYEIELSVPNPHLILKEGLKGRIVIPNKSKEVS